MWHGVPFACQRRPIIGVLRMCWLLPGSFDCFCCPHTSAHRPSIACLAVVLCGPGALFLHALSGPSTICPFPPHSWSAPDGLPLLLRKQPIWAAGDTPHLMPVEQGLPWHPVATGLARQAIPFIVAASHAHAPPFAPFWFPVPAVLVASPALLCPSFLQGGGEIAVWGGRIQLRKIAEKLRKNCEKLRKIAEKLRKNCDVVSGPPEPSRCNNSGQVAQKLVLHVFAPEASTFCVLAGAPCLQRVIARMFFVDEKQVYHSRCRTSTPHCCQKCGPQRAHQGTVPSFATETCCSILPLHPHDQPRVFSSKNHTQQPPQTGAVSQMQMPCCWCKKKRGNMQTCRHEKDQKSEGKKTKKAKVTILCPAGFEPRTPELQCSATTN